MNKIQKLEPVTLHGVQVEDTFWKWRIDTFCKEVIDYQWRALNDQVDGAEPSHAIENFRIAAGVQEGEFHGQLFQDSDVAKWIEAASFSLKIHPNKEIEKKIDDIVDIMAKAQQPDGYLNTYFTVAKPDGRWTDFSHGHELYCAGHLIEAAVAYYEATNKNKLLEIVCRYVDYIDQSIGPEEGKIHAYSGHPEIELALVKLFRATGNDKYLKLSDYFINERGKQPSFLTKENTFGFIFKDKWFDLNYHQAHAPISEQTTGEGHAVRAMYLYAALADLARETSNKEMVTHLKLLWNNVVNKRMYVTGAIGSHAHGERFTYDYDLPNDRAYAETCASIGLVFWAHRMLQLDNNRQYADTMERVFYNSFLSGVSQDGMKYFYVNPLEVIPKEVDKRFDLTHVKPERVHWFGCACCPPNIARVITSLGQYIYTHDHEGIKCHLYIGNNAEFNVEGKRVSLTQQTKYPNDGQITISINTNEPNDFPIWLRIPEWCKEYSLTINGDTHPITPLQKGYMKIKRTWRNGDEIKLDLKMDVKVIRTHPKVKSNVGKVAIQYGPLIYCLEEVDNGPDLSTVYLPKDAVFDTLFDKGLLGGVTMIRTTALRLDQSKWGDSLYQPTSHTMQPVEIKAVPYGVWGNRNPGEMVVWIQEC